MSWLYRYVVKSIQGFILATERLREMKGASASASVESLGELLDEALAGQGTKRLSAAAPLPQPRTRR